MLMGMKMCMSWLVLIDEPIVFDFVIVVPLPLVSFSGFLNARAKYLVHQQCKHSNTVLDHS
jgi:hypothetical protein